MDDTMVQISSTSNLVDNETDDNDGFLSSFASKILLDMTVASISALLFLVLVLFAFKKRQQLKEW